MALAEHSSVAHNMLNRVALKTAGHTSATGAIVLSWAHVINDIAGACATLLACAWYTVTLLESETGKKVVAKVKARFEKKPPAPPASQA